MTIEYEFANLNTALATWVFVANSQDRQAAHTCDQVAVAQANFYYTPWQFLNASAGAREYFNFSGDLAVVARLAAAPSEAAARASALTPVFPGRRYLAFAGEKAMQVVDLGEDESSAVTVVAAPSSVNPCNLSIDWYLDTSRIGITEPVLPRTIASFQAGDTLLFEPTTPGTPPPRLTPDQLTGARRYRAPKQTLRVKVVLRKQPGQDAGYSFSPPSIAA